MKQREVTNFANRGNLIASLCKIGYFPHRIFGIFHFEMILLYKFLEHLPYCCFLVFAWNKPLYSSYIMRHSPWQQTSEPPHDKTSKWLCSQRRLKSAWASTQSDQSSLCAQWVAKDQSFLHADSEDSDQTSRMPRLSRVFAGCTCHFGFGGWSGFLVPRGK